MKLFFSSDKLSTFGKLQIKDGIDPTNLLFEALNVTSPAGELDIWGRDVNELLSRYRLCKEYN